MTSRRGKRKHTIFSQNYEIPKPRTPLTCEHCGVHIECTTNDMLKAYIDHVCQSLL